MSPARFGDALLIVDLLRVSCFRFGSSGFTANCHVLLNSFLLLEKAKIPVIFQRFRENCQCRLC